MAKQLCAYHIFRHTNEQQYFFYITWPDVREIVEKAPSNSGQSDLICKGPVYVQVCILIKQEPHKCQLSVDWDGSSAWLE